MTVFAQGFGVSFAKTVSAVYRRDNPVQALKQRIASRRIALRVTSAGANVYRPTNTSRVPCLLTPHWCPARVGRRVWRLRGLPLVAVMKAARPICPAENRGERRGRPQRTQAEKVWSRVAGALRQCAGLYVRQQSGLFHGLAGAEGPRGGGAGASLVRPRVAFRAPSDSLHEVVIRSSHAADVGIGSMDAFRTGLGAGARTGRDQRRGAAHHDKRTEPPDTNQPRTPRQTARLHVLPPAVREHPQGEKVRLGRRLSASGLQLHGASRRADNNADQPLEQWRPRLRERHRHGSGSLPVSV